MTSAWTEALNFLAGGLLVGVAARFFDVAVSSYSKRR